jgi:hypothetical protein
MFLLFSSYVVSRNYFATILCVENVPLMTKLNKSKIKWLINWVVKDKQYPFEIDSIHQLSVRSV